MSATFPAVESTVRDDAALFAATGTLNRLGLSANSHAALIVGIERTLHRLVDIEKVGVAVWVDDGQYLQTLPGSFGASDDLAASSQVDVMDQRSGAARVMLTGRAWFTNNASSHIPDFNDWVLGFGIRQLMTVPLAGASKRIGVLHLANVPSGFTATDLAIVEEIAPFVAATVEHVLRRIALEQKEALANLIAESASGVASGQTLQRLAAGPLSKFRSAAGANLLAISFAGETGARVLLEGRGVPAELKSELLREAQVPRQALRMRRVRSTGVGDSGATFAHVPVLVAGRHQATLSLLRIPGSPFNADDLKAIRRLGNVIALAWATESYRREFELRARLHERQRIADDLHDHVAQILFSAELALQSMIEDLADDAVVLPAATHARDLLVRSEVSLRDAIHQLSAPESLRMSERLESIVKDVEGEFGVAIRLEISETDATRTEALPTGLATVVLRAAREGMVNAAKHAQPCRVTVALRVTHDDKLVLTVDDDGSSELRTRDMGHGLAAMRRMLAEQGGTLRLSRERGSLTTFRVTVPLLLS